MKPFISLCMIVKDEEKVLERCLNSVINLVDEIIVVDTGSTDSTKVIASKYTIKIFDFEWCGDFSAARNFAASHATGEWILVLDADEYVDEENFNVFIKELKNDNGIYDAYAAKILNFTGQYGESLIQNYHGRIYKNNGDIVYYRNIHEQFKNVKGEQLKIKNSSLLIFHSGYLNKRVEEKNKSERNKFLLKKELNKGVDTAFDYFNFGNEYSSIGEYEKALDSYLLAYKNKKDFRLPWVSNALVQIINCLIKLKRYSDALKVINDAEKMYNESPEFPYLKAEVFLLRGQLDEAKDTYIMLIKNQNKYKDIILGPDLKDLKPHIRLGEIYLYEENYDASIYHFSNVLNINKYDKYAISKVIEILNKFHTRDEINEFLKTNDLVNNKNIITYVRASFNEGNPSLAKCLLEDYGDEFTLLRKVAELKEICINSKGNINDIKDILQLTILKNLIESSWINIVDILLLRNNLSMDKDLLNVVNTLRQNEQINKLINLVDGNESLDNIEEDIVVYTLQVLLTYKKYDLCNVILKEIEKTDQNTILKVARILFKNGFKGEALELYDLCDWNSYIEQDFVNIINSLIETNNITGAVQVAQFAITIFNYDFRFYYYILQHTNDEILYQSTINKVRELF